ncbi:MAG TPA: hypothetical protein VM871_03240 [Flavisolibacter sp.]|jgi:hypothetical protein|nr:hypothetical protein [Flavisolibacter sp.]
MQDLIKQIVEKTGIPADKAQQVLSVVGNFVKQKFPMAAGQVDGMLGSSGGTSSGDDKGNDLIGGLGSKFGL